MTCLCDKLVRVLGTLTRQQEAANVGVAGGERVVDPSAADEESSGRVGLLGIRQRPEAVPPETESVELRADDPRIADQPRGRAERDAHAHERHQEHADADVPGQASLLHRRRSYVRSCSPARESQTKRPPDD